MPHSYADTTSVTCPQCARSFSATVWLVIDAQDRPDLAHQCDSGTIHDAQCPNCEMVVGRFQAPLLYHDVEEHLLILSVPPDMPDEQINPTRRELFARLAQQMPAWGIRPYLATTSIVKGVDKLALALLMKTNRAEQLFQRGLEALRKADGTTETPTAVSWLQDQVVNIHKLRQLAREADPMRSVGWSEGETLSSKLTLFVEANTWSSSRTILEQYPELLTDDAFAILTQQIEVANQQGNKVKAQILIEHLDLLTRCREDDVSPAFDDKLRYKRSMDDRTQHLQEEAREKNPVQIAWRQALLGKKSMHQVQAMISAVQPLLECSTLEEVAVLITQHPIVLTDEFMEFLKQGVEFTRIMDGEAWATHHQHRYELLRYLRRLTSGREPESVELGYSGTPEQAGYAFYGFLAPSLSTSEKETVHQVLEKLPDQVRSALDKIAISQHDAISLTPNIDALFVKYAEQACHDGHSERLYWLETFHAMLIARWSHVQDSLLGTMIVFASTRENLLHASQFHIQHQAAFGKSVESFLASEIERARDAGLLGVTRILGRTLESLKYTRGVVRAFERAPIEPTPNRKGYVPDILDWENVAQMAVMYPTAVTEELVRDNPINKAAQRVSSGELTLDQVIGFGLLPQVDQDDHWAIDTYVVALSQDRRQLEAACILAEINYASARQNATPWIQAHCAERLMLLYNNRFGRDKPEYLQRALEVGHQTLNLLQSTDDWWEVAVIRREMGAAYAMLFDILGYRTLLNKAINSLRLALDAFPPGTDGWASTQGVLSGALMRASDIGLGPSGMLLDAIEAIHSDLKVRFPHTDQWAELQANLGLCLRRIFVSTNDLSIAEVAIDASRAATMHFKPPSPDWIRAQHNLASVMATRFGITHERVHGEQALVAFQQTLDHSAPGSAGWARVLRNLAGLYHELSKLGNHDEYVRQAVVTYEQALSVFDPDLFPEPSRACGSALGDLHYESERDFAAACAAYAGAAQAVEKIRGVPQRDEDRRGLAEANEKLYARLVHSCLVLGDKQGAFGYAVAAKGRAFVDLLASARVDLSKFPSDLDEKVKKARDIKLRQDILLARIGEESSTQLDNTLNAGTHSELKNQLIELRQLEDRLWHTIHDEYPDYFATQAAEPFTLQQAQDLARELKATLVEYYLHAGGWVAFIIHQDGSSLAVVDLPFSNAQLKDTWSAFVDRLEACAASNERRLGDLYDMIIAPLQAYLPPANQENPERLVLAPFSLLHLVPLTALKNGYNDTNPSYLGEDFVVVTTPSLAVLDRVVHRIPVGQAQRQLCTVAYPGVPGSKHYLANVLPEAQAITRHFSTVTSLWAANATPEATIQHGPEHLILHCACHGSFDVNNADHSGLMLAGGWLRTRDIFNNLRLPNTSLVVLSACATGQVVVHGGDELTGLVQAFLYAGSPVVVASLWQVNDAATRYLFERFYTHYAAGIAVADALRAAQHELRYRGYTHPYYWAAFQPIGAAYGTHSMSDTSPIVSAKEPAK